MLLTGVMQKLYKTRQYISPYQEYNCESYSGRYPLSVRSLVKGSSNVAFFFTLFITDYSYQPADQLKTIAQFCIGLLFLIKYHGISKYLNRV